MFSKRPAPCTTLQPDVVRLLADKYLPPTAVLNLGQTCRFFHHHLRDLIPTALNAAGQLQSQLLSFVIQGNTDGVEVLLKSNPELLLQNIVKSQMTALQLAWDLRDITMTRLILSYFRNMNNGMLHAHQQICDRPWETKQRVSQHYWLFYTAMSSISFTESKPRVDYEKKFRDIGKFGIHDLIGFCLAIEEYSRNHHTRNAFHEFSDEEFDEIRNLMKIALEFSPQYLKKLILPFPSQYPNHTYHFIALRSRLLEHQEQLGKEFAGLRRQILLDAAINKVSNIFRPR